MGGVSAEDSVGGAIWGEGCHSIVQGGICY